MLWTAIFNFDVYFVYLIKKTYTNMFLTAIVNFYVNFVYPMLSYT